MNNKIKAIIAGCVAAAALIAAVLIIVKGRSDTGLYITEVKGNVNISNSEDNVSETASAGRKLKKGDVVTAGGGSACKLVYRTRKNKDTNFMMLSESSQLFVTELFDGKTDTDVYLNRGTIISANAEDLGASAVIRTANCSVGTGCAVSVVSYTIDDSGNYTDFASMGGDLYIQQYDEHGIKVNDEELLAPGKNGRVISGSGGPYFAFLNTDAKLTDYSAAVLRELFSVASLVKMEFSSADIKAAYDEIGGGQPDMDNISDETAVTIPDGSDLTIQTAETIATTMPDGRTSESLTTTIITSESESDTSETTEETSETTSETTSQTTTASETESETTSVTTDENPDELFTVYIYAGDNEFEQYVAYGENAVRPEDPYIEGKRFIGWDGSFDNITGNRTITAMFEDDDGGGDNTQYASTHTVTVIIGDKTTVQEVSDGESASLPSTITLEGYTFKGWDGDYSDIRSDTTITAVLEPVTVNVTFIVDGSSYYTTVGYGGTVSEPVSPTQNSSGQNFVGWDKPLSDITSDTTITALFDQAVEHITEQPQEQPADTEYTEPEPPQEQTKYYNVTFIANGTAYTQTVTEGDPASAPVPPATDSEGRSFRGWDSDFSSVYSDMTITAIYD